MAESSETNEDQPQASAEAEASAAQEPQTPPAEDAEAPDARTMAEQALAAAQQHVDDLDDATALPAGTQVTDIDMLGDVDLHVTIELGRTRMLLEDVLKLADGSVVELDKLAGDPVDVFVNNCLIARGEVLVLNDNFCIRVSEIVENLEEQAEDAALQQLQAN